MSGYALRDAEEARRFLLQGWWWQRVLPPRPSRMRAVLEWALEIASADRELPPIGFLADLGHLALGESANEPEASATANSGTGVSPVGGTVDRRDAGPTFTGGSGVSPVGGTVDRRDAGPTFTGGSGGSPVGGSGVSPVGGSGVSPVGGSGVSPVGGSGVSPVGGTGVSPVVPSLTLPARWTVLLRTYEDHVLGKFYADWTFNRASDALRRYKGRDQARGLAFLFRRFAERSAFRGVRLSPGVIKSVLEAPADEVHLQGWESLSSDGLQESLVAQYEMLIAAARRTSEVFAPEDVFLLERGTALKPEGEQLAEQQVLRAVHLLEESLPRHRLRPLHRRGDVSTRILDEDTYPVGGFASLATRGSVESLLHSQLAYMDDGQRPDLFDIKFLRDELLYYARDENQFLRRRRTFVFVLYPDLDQTRFKDRSLDYQRGVLLLALLYTIVRKLAVWLNADALSFHFLFVVEDGNDSLQAERDLLASLLREEIANGGVRLAVGPEHQIADRCSEWARRSLCHVLLIDVQPRRLNAPDATIDRLRIDGPRPAFGDAEGEPTLWEDEEPLESWSHVLQEILQRWI